MKRCASQSLLSSWWLQTNCEQNLTEVGLWVCLRDRLDNWCRKPQPAVPFPSKEMLNNTRGKDTYIFFPYSCGYDITRCLSFSLSPEWWTVTCNCKPQKSFPLPTASWHGVCQSTRKIQAIRDVWKMVRYTSTGISFCSLWHKFVLR